MAFNEHLTVMHAGAFNRRSTSLSGSIHNTGMKKLTHMMLRSNPKLQLPDSDPGFDHLPSLEELLVADSDSVKMLRPGLFAQLPALKQVRFELNINLESIAKGVFRGGSSIQSLELIRNDRLTKLDPGCFEGLVNLETLILQFSSAGGLRDLPQGSLLGLGALQTLDAHVPKLTHIADGAFTPLTKLTVLRLSGAAGLVSLPNIAEELGKHLEEISLANLGVVNPTFPATRPMHQLTKLSMRCMRGFTKIGAAKFGGLTNCKHLALISTGLTAIAPAAFQGMAKLVRLELNHNANLTRLEPATFDGAFDHDPASPAVSIMLQGNGLKFISQHALNFDRHGAPAKATLVTAASHAGTQLYDCCSYLWLYLEPRWTTHRLKCLNSRGEKVEAISLRDKRVVFGCCFEDREWQEKLELLAKHERGSKADLPSTIKNATITFCENSLLENDHHDVHNGPTLRVRDAFRLKHTVQNYPSTESTCNVTCAPGTRLETSGRRHLLDCEPWLHRTRDYQTKFAFAERHCADCLVANCAVCDSNYRQCEQCKESFSLFRASGRANVTADKCTRQCPAGLFSQRSDVKHSANASRQASSYTCQTVKACGELDVLTHATSTSDRVCDNRPVVERDDGGLGIALGVLFAVSVVIVAALMFSRYRQWHNEKQAYNFEDNSADLVHSIKLSSNTTSDVVLPKEIPRSHVQKIEEIASCYFGPVWKVKLFGPDSPSGCEAAAKILNTEPDADEKKKTDLRREAVLMAQLVGHVNVVELLGVVTAGKPMMLLISYCENGSLLSQLRNRAQRTDAFSITAKWTFGKQICAGMQFLAQKRVVHRDLASLCPRPLPLGFTSPPLLKLCGLVCACAVGCHVCGAVVYVCVPFTQ